MKQIGVALPADLRLEIEHEAARQGHSIAAEIRDRLWSTFLIHGPPQSVEAAKRAVAYRKFKALKGEDHESCT